MQAGMDLADVQPLLGGSGGEPGSGRVGGVDEQHPLPGLLQCIGPRQDPAPGADAAAHCSPGGGGASSSCALLGRDEGPMRSCRTIRAVVCTTSRWGLRRITTPGITRSTCWRPQSVQPSTAAAGSA